MKKTIAILLVLVIAGVGLFAAANTFDSILNIGTVIAPINQMAVTAANTPYVWTTPLDGENFTAFPSESAYSGLTDIDHYNKDGVVAYLQARSNNRNGFKIDMNATALASTVGSVTEYIDYIAKCGDAVVTTVAGATTVNSGTVGTILYANEVAYLDVTEITVNLTEKLEDAAEGTYTGTITFTYTAV